MKLEGGGDGAVNVIPCHIDDTNGRVRKIGKSVREEIQVIQSATRAFVNDLKRD